jgi:SAM-dependent methyltransferase
MKAPFDDPETVAFNDARGATLRSLLEGLKPSVELVDGFDVGCGFGYFANVLNESGLRTGALDGRPENIAEASRRHPGIDFQVGNAESPSLAELGTFDVVSCFGLLYHLENPFAAVRNLAAMTGKVLVAESVVVPNREPVAVLYEEEEDVDQGLTYYALIPSESLLVKALYVVGFEHVYVPSPLPDHPQFRAGSGKRRRRAMLVASRQPLASPVLRKVPEPRTRRHLWDAVPLPGMESPKVRSAVRALRGLRTTR